MSIAINGEIGIPKAEKSTSILCFQVSFLEKNVFFFLEPRELEATDSCEIWQRGLKPFFFLSE